MPSVLRSVNMLVIESVTLPSTTLDKELFTEYPTKNTS
jgi:hypothetical protein